MGSNPDPDMLIRGNPLFFLPVIILQIGVLAIAKTYPEDERTLNKTVTPI